MNGGRQLPIRSIAVVAATMLGCLSAFVPAPLTPTSAQSQQPAQRGQYEPQARGAGAGSGYILVGTDGGVFAFGTTPFEGSIAGHPLAAPIVAAAEAPDGRGYWLAGRDRGVFAFGDAPFYGSQDDISFGPCPSGVGCGARPLVPVDPDPAVAITAGPPPYDIVMSDGGIYPYGGSQPADFAEGGASSAVAPGLVAPVVGVTRSTVTGGFWEAAADGGVFGEPGQPFYGSLAATRLAAPVVGIVATADGGGYWLVASDGGVFSFGDASFYGSLPSLGVHPTAPIVGMASTPDGQGYWLVGADGGVFSFGDASYLGGMAGHGLGGPIVAIATP